MAIKAAPTNRPSANPRGSVSTKKVATAGSIQTPSQRQVGGVYSGSAGSGGGSAASPADEKNGTDWLSGNKKYIIIAVALLAVYFLFIKKR